MDFTKKDSAGQNTAEQNMEQDIIELFTGQLNMINIAVNEKMLDSFNTYYEMLDEWNKVMNLTAITGKQEVYVKHFLDSLAVSSVFSKEELKSEILERRQLKVIDIGTGAGFPGIPLKIAFPDFEITLLDSLNKRVKFLNEVIQKLQLENITAIHGRAEDFAHKKEHRERYDLCVSRAVANLAVLSEYCMPYVALGGYFIAYKSGEVFTEIEMSVKAIETLGGKLAHVEKMQLPGTDIERSFVIIKKCAGTSGKYPRKAGLPSNKPLI